MVNKLYGWRWGVTTETTNATRSSCGGRRRWCGLLGRQSPRGRVGIIISSSRDHRTTEEVELARTFFLWAIYTSHQKGGGRWYVDSIDILIISMLIFDVSCGIAQGSSPPSCLMFTLLAAAIYYFAIWVPIYTREKSHLSSFWFFVILLK